MIKRLRLFILMSYLFTLSSLASELEKKIAIEANAATTVNKEVNNLVAKRRPSNLSYKQMMGGMGNAFLGIQIGIISQDKELVKAGVTKINEHPAPKDKPWTIVKYEKKLLFKQTLLSYDKLLHTNATDILKALETSDWIKINQEVFTMSNNCVSCHSLWKNNLK